MKLIKALLFFICLSYADTTIVAFNAVHQSFGNLGNNRTVIDTIQFPESNSTFSEIIMNVNLECPDGGCDPWDRKAKISVMHFKEWHFSKYLYEKTTCYKWHLDEKIKFCIKWVLNWKKC